MPKSFTIMPQYKIIDYTYPTAGELARLILQYKEVDYEDEKVDSPDKIYEAEEDSPFGVLPILQVDGKTVAQGHGICRYLARQLGLIGNTSEEAARCDMVMDGLGAMFAKVRGTHVAKLDTKQQIALFKQMIEEDVPRFLEKYEQFLVKSNLSSGYFASEQLTWCDLGVALTFAGMQIRQPKLLENYPRLKAFVEKVTSNETVSHFIETELAPSAVLRKTSINRHESGNLSGSVLVADTQWGLLHEKEKLGALICTGLPETLNETNLYSLVKNNAIRCCSDALT